MNPTSNEQSWKIGDRAQSNHRISHSKEYLVIGFEGRDNPKTSDVLPVADQAITPAFTITFSTLHLSLSMFEYD